MSYSLLWIFFLVIQAFAVPRPTQKQFDSSVGDVGLEPVVNSRNVPKYEDSANSQNEQVISVRITSSVAVGRSRGKSTKRPPEIATDHAFKKSLHESSPTNTQSTLVSPTTEGTKISSTDIPPNLIGANIEYIKQLNAKKELKEQSTESLHPYQIAVKNRQNNDNESMYDDDESSTIFEEYDDEIENIPLARKVPSASDINQLLDEKNKTVSNFNKTRLMNYNTQNKSTQLSDLLDDSVIIKPKENFRGDSNNNTNATAMPVIEQHTERRDINKFTPDGTRLFSSNYQSDDSIAESSIKSVEFTKTDEIVGNIPKPPSQNNFRGVTRIPANEGRGSSILTTVSFNIVHDPPKLSSTNHEPSDPYRTHGQIIANQQHFYDQPKIYSQPSQIYSEPAKFYSEPAKIYSEPAKIYSKPAKIYSEPAKVYSEPAKIYSEPAKFYSEPASLHLNQNISPTAPPNYTPWRPRSQSAITGTTDNTTPLTTAISPSEYIRAKVEHQPEKNYEVDEEVSVLTDGRSHGVQETTTEKCKQDNCKVGYVVEGRQYKKYRVEERTSDGFIVGEYGVVRNEDGALRGVRYTADSDASPRLIQDALMKFLQLK